MITSFGFFLLCYLAVGAFAVTRKRADTVDYLLAGREVSPWLTALSAVATNNSGFMFIGLIGATYTAGLSTVWIMVGWISGDYLAWRWVFRSVRERTEQAGVVSIPSFLGTEGVTEQQSEPQQRAVVVLSALITLVFLGTYAAAQLTAGSKALHVLFGWNESVGTIIGATVVALYCFAGGIRASIWTDATQSVVMLASMALLLFVSLTEIGGVDALWTRLKAIDPALVDWRPPDLRFGFALYLIGWIVAGVGVLGQPHIMIRAMAIDHSDHVSRARRIYFSWYVTFTCTAILVGLCCRVLLPGSAEFDAELALPTLSQQLLPGVLVGFILAGLFAATISTADSQILSCSAALTQDILPRWGESYARTKAGTLIITAAVVGIVMLGNQSVFQLVVLSWSALAGALGPLLALRALGRAVPGRVGVTMMLGGLGTVLLWRYAFQLSAAVYEVLPGMAVGFLVYGAYVCWRKKPA